ncbi:MAG: hypothetical protein K8J31_28050, partial [Anaerolineae bacterium]|nr:hypothetical protein [Anaerolineae bacterium]
MPKLPAFLPLILLAAACASSPASNAPNVESASVQSADGNVQNVVEAASGTLPIDAAGQALVARVNGQGITEAQFESVLNRTQQQIRAA